MKARSDIYTWPMALVVGSVITLALFFTLPALHFRQINPEPPVIEIDFMQWREPTPMPKAKVPAPPKPLRVKPKPRPVIKERPELPVRVKPPETPVVPMVKEAVIPEKIVSEELPVTTPPIVEQVEPPQPVQVNDANAAQPEEDLPVPTPIFKLTALPRFAHKVDPEYPPAMRVLGREARVKLAVLVDPKGSVRKVTILESGGEAFDQAAISAIQASSFIPGNIEGKPVTVLMRIPIVFRLK